MVIRRTGLSADLLRAWERRYGAVVPERSPGGQRLYTEEDVERLQLLRQLTQSGHAIGQVAPLATARLREILMQEEAAGLAARGDGNGHGAGPADALQAQALELIAQLDGAGLEALLRRTAQHEGMTTTVEGVVVPVMREVGERWHRRELDPAHEHLATSVIERTIHWMLDGTATADDASRIAFATTQGERHEVGIQVTAAFAAAEGWRPVYLGADLPARAIAMATERAGARVLAISVASGMGGALDELRQIRELLPDRIAVVVGGAGAAALTGDLPPGVSRLPDLASLRAYLRSFDRAGKS